MLAEGLWRWSAVHPEWKEGQGWDAEVWCVYAETPDAVVLVDPLVPADDADRFWQALDRDVERLGRPVAVLVSSTWHERSAATVESRYGATRERPAGVEAFTVSQHEIVFWLPAHAALVAGDALMGTTDGIRLQPESWLEGEPYAPFVENVGALLSLPVELVLPSHGPAALSDGRAALERAVRHAQSSAATAE